MELQNFEMPEKLKSILDRFQNAINKRSDFDLGFNIFSLVSDTYYKENFHSQIISAILNPKEKHNDEKIHLDLFFDFLINNLNCRIDKSNYNIDLGVHNEFPIQNQRRIDILIKSKTHAIIIENKIYNAADMDNQLVDYYNHCKKIGLEVDAIVYLSLDGNKRPDKAKWNAEKETIDAINSKIKHASAFDISPKKSLYNWLEECEIKSENEDLKFIIKHYKQLLKSLRKFIMETNEIKDYYEWLSKLENKEKASEIEIWFKLHSELIKYYPERLIDKIEADKSIRECYSISKTYNENAAIFENIGGDNKYYLMVTFYNEKMNTGLYSIEIRENGYKWIHNDMLKVNSDFVNLFHFTDKWVFNNQSLNLLENFDGLVKNVKDSLFIASKVIKQSINLNV